MAARSRPRARALTPSCIGAPPVEVDWPVVLDANIRGAINIREGARRAKVERTVFASFSGRADWIP
jgi:hypothetical protein